MKRIINWSIALAILLVFSIIFPTLPVKAQASDTPLPALPALTKFTMLPDLAIPHDIPLDTEQEQALQKTDFPALQRIFDIFSWHSFLGVNALDNQGIPRWASWKESLQVFRSDGATPVDSTESFCPQNNEGMRELYLTSSVFSNTKDTDSLADEVNQAFTSPLYDQNGKPVRYEIFINNDEYDYILAKKLYNLDGQIDFSKSHKPANFPAGKFNDGTNKVGSIELKLAWKEIDEEKDVSSRFYTETLLLPRLDEKGEPIMDENGNFTKCDKKLMGLVGMHISHKTASSPQWIWSTFENVDNLLVNNLEVVDGKRLHPLFHDDSAAGQILPVNVAPIKRNAQGEPDAAGIMKTQVARLIPIPKDKEALNHEVQALLHVAGSPFQYYELIDTQWPTDPKATAVAGGPDPSNLPQAITRKSSGAPAPVYLTNSIMETYLQAGNQTAHFQENGFPFNNAPVFGTESCMGCHSSAGLAVNYTLGADGIKKAVFGGNETGDFSWLLQLKANFFKSAANVQNSQ